MVSSFLKSLLDHLSPDIITELFVIGVIGIFVLANIFAYSGKYPKFKTSASSIMTSIGIFGTFVGVVVGLLNFDPTEVEKSIPSLLTGLKTAFITSIAGLFFSILFNILNALLYSTIDEEKFKSGPTAEKFLDRLTLQNDQLSQILEVNTNFFTQTVQLNSSIKSLEKSYWNGANKLVSSFDDFSSEMTASTAKIIKDTLQQVVDDFNSNLFEQFGSNFAALDSSVKELVGWQHHNKSQLEVLIQLIQSTHNLYSNNLELLDQAKLSVSELVDELKQMARVLPRIKRITELNEKQIDSLTNSLDVFVAMRTKAESAVPALKYEIEQIANNLNDGAKSVSNSLTKREQDLNELSKNIDSIFEKLFNNLNKHVQNLDNNFSTAHQAALAAIESQSLTMANNLKASLLNAQTAFDSSILDSSDKINSELSSNIIKMEKGLTSKFDHKFNQLSKKIDENTPKSLFSKLLKK